MNTNYLIERKEDDESIGDRGDRQRWIAGGPETCGAGENVRAFVRDVERAATENRRTITMKNATFVKAAGVAGVFGATLWVVALFIEYAYGLFQPGGGTLYVANQAMFFVAQLCYLTVIAGLMGAGAAGDGWFGKMSLGVFFFGWAALAAALALSLLFDSPIVDPIILMGAIASTLGGFLSGIAVAVAWRLRGFWRFAPLIQGSYQLFIGFLPVVLANREPTQLTESLGAATWFLIGLALIVNARYGGSAARTESREPIGA